MNKGLLHCSTHKYNIKNMQTPHQSGHVFYKGPFCIIEYNFGNAKKLAPTNSFIEV